MSVELSLKWCRILSGFRLATFSLESRFEFAVASDLQRRRRMERIGYSFQVIERLTERERESLFQQWQPPETTAAADELLRNFEPVSLRVAREALLISTIEMAKRLGTSTSAYVSLELRAREGRTSIETLNEAAKAMGCECVVTIRPVDRQSFAWRIWVPLLNAGVDTKWFKAMANTKLLFALRDRLPQLLYEPKFRRAQKWTRIHNQGRRRWYH